MISHNMSEMLYLRPDASRAFGVLTESYGNARDDNQQHFSSQFKNRHNKDTYDQPFDR
ncbi:hypothetical protein [Paenarthrobacter nicotinovorans]|uniref:hypothetical protein n=1 Tax=Paenarthrobacter nicotinovorans TaxID=29320 RepID=UPI003A813AC8